MSKYGYIGKDGPTQAIRSNAGVLNPNEYKDLAANEKLLLPGQLELIETKTHSSDVNAVDFTSLGNYDVHFVTITNAGVDTNNKRIALRFRENGTWETGTVYKYAHFYHYISGTGELQSTGDSELEFIYEVNSTSGNANSHVTIYDAIDPTKNTFMHQETTRYNTSYSQIWGSGVLPQQSKVDGFRFFVSDSANFSSYTISLYGIKEYS